MDPSFVENNREGCLRVLGMYTILLFGNDPKRDTLVLHYDPVTTRTTSFSYKRLLTLAFHNIPCDGVFMSVYQRLPNEIKNMYPTEFPTEEAKERRRDAEEHSLKYYRKKDSTGPSTEDRRQQAEHQYLQQHQVGIENASKLDAYDLQSGPRGKVNPQDHCKFFKKFTSSLNQLIQPITSNQTRLFHQYMESQFTKAIQLDPLTTPTLVDSKTSNATVMSSSSSSSTTYSPSSLSSAPLQSSTFENLQNRVHLLDQNGIYSEVQTRKYQEDLEKKQKTGMLHHPGFNLFETNQMCQWSWHWGVIETHGRRLLKHNNVIFDYRFTKMKVEVFDYRECIKCSPTPITNGVKIRAEGPHYRVSIIHNLPPFHHAGTPCEDHNEFECGLEIDGVLHHAKPRYVLDHVHILSMINPGEYFTYWHCIHSL